MIVCLNKPQNSVCFILHRPEDIDEYIFIPECMELVEMPELPNRHTTEDYLDYFVIDGKWVRIDQVPEEYFDL